MNHDTNEQQPTMCGCMPRRAVLQGMVAVGTMLATSAAFSQDDAGTGPQVGDFLTRGAADAHLGPDDVRLDGRPIKAFAVSPDGQVRRGVTNQLSLVHLADTELTAAAKTSSAGGVFAFTAICTHAGCVISGWEDDSKQFACPCHGSHFDAKDNGAVAEGPAQRKLPQLGLKVADGKLVIASAFDGRIGGDETM